MPPAAALVVAAAVLPSSPHKGMRAARGIRSRALLAFAPCPPACPRWRRWRRGRGAKAARPSRRVRCAPPVAACVRRSRAAAAVGRLAARSPLKGFEAVARVPSLPARRRARARVRLRGKLRWGGLLAPCGRLKPPPLLRPRPPVKYLGRGLWLSCVRCGGVGDCARCGGRGKDRPLWGGLGGNTIYGACLTWRRPSCSPTW